jgi:hypothetical protein
VLSGYDPGMTDMLPDEYTLTPTPAACTVCHALTYDVDAHTSYHTAVANADPLMLPDNIPATVD